MQINAINQIAETPATVKLKAETVEKNKPETKTAEPVKARESQTENLEKLKVALSEHNISLKYSLDDQTKALVVKMVDERTGEAVRQIPTEVSLKLAAEFIKMQGLFVDKQVKE